MKENKKEIVLYLFFGGLTFLVSVFSFSLFHVQMNMNELVANVLSWILAVSFAFFTNRIWVFKAPTNNVASFLKQMCSFFAGRIFTLVIEEVILYIFITRLAFHSLTVKVSAQIIVILLNYVISKMIVFRR